MMVNADARSLHALLSACGLRFEQPSSSEHPDWVEWPIPFERPGYVHPVTILRASITDEQRADLAAQAAELDTQLFAQRPPWPEPTPAERWAEVEERERFRWSLYSDAERTALRLRSRRDRVRYGCWRLRAGNEYRWARPLAVVRVETAEALRELGHVRFARWVDGDATPTRRGSAVQLELGV